MIPKDSRDNRENDFPHGWSIRVIRKGGRVKVSQRHGRNLNLRRSPGKDISVVILHKWVVKHVNSLPFFATGFFPHFGVKPDLQLAKNLPLFKGSKNQIWRICYFQQVYTICRNSVIIGRQTDFRFSYISTFIFLSPSKLYITKNTEFGPSRCQGAASWDWLLSVDAVCEELH